MQTENISVDMAIKGVDTIPTIYSTAQQCCLDLGFDSYIKTKGLSLYKFPAFW